eukprot:GHUV01036903.1.p1 GENE.GHUV01036903.1~~GHUV01036903.1.p1  ORF type:complete len:228 (-),score=64.99 GHUV01036903.1:508-1191(-)
MPILQARDENNQPRLSGGDSFQVLLVPRPALKTASSQPVTAAATTAEGGRLDSRADQQQEQCIPGVLGNELSQDFSDSTFSKQLGRSKLISHPLLLSYNSSTGTVSSRQDSTISLQHSQVDVKPQESLDNLSLHADEDHDIRWHADSATVVAVAVGDIQDNGDGTYSCSYSHVTAGLFELHVTNGKLWGQQVGLQMSHNKARDRQRGSSCAGLLVRHSVSVVFRSEK